MSYSNGWQSTSLGEMLTFQRGFDITKKEQEPGPYPVISSSGPGSTHREYKVEGPGVVIGRKGTLGSVFFAASAFWPHDTTLWVKDFHGNDPRFAYYFLQTMHLEQYDAGASNPTLNRNHIHTIQVYYPSLTVQRKIAGILSAYDDLIENNTRRIAILEAMAQALYREWFVHFRYPGHESMPLVESELGMVPEGWEVTRLSQLVETQYGYTESARDEIVGPKFIRGMDINKASYIQWDTVPYCPIGAIDYQKYKVAVGDVFVIRMADPGKVGIVEKDIDAVFASYLIRLRITSLHLRPYYLFYFLLSDRYQDYVTGASTGTTRKSASAGVITDIDVIVPPLTILRHFEEQTSALRAFLTNLLDRNANLRRTRDLLLPKLISGEVDVAGVEIITGEPA